MVGQWTAEEQEAARMALHKAPEMIPTLKHLHGRETVIISHIDEENAPLWEQAQQANAITWDMGNVGLVRFVEGRYAEHYCI